MFRRWLVFFVFTLLLAASGCHKHLRCYRHCFPCRAIPVCDPCCGTSFYVSEAVPVEIAPPVVVSGPIVGGPAVSGSIVGGPAVSGPIVSGPAVSASPVVVGSPAFTGPLGATASPAPATAPLPMPTGTPLTPLPTNTAPPFASSPLPR